MILSYDANLGRMEFSEGTGVPIYRKGCGSSVLVFDEELDVIVVMFSRHFLEGVESVNAACDPTYPESDRK